MTNDSHGEAFGTKTLNLAVIGVSVIIMLGVLWQPAPKQIVAAKPAAQIEHVAAKVPAPRPSAG